jgi:hypothetical protein
MPTPESISNKYRDIFLKNQLYYKRAHRAIFNKIAGDFAQLVNDPSIKFTRAFKFPPEIEKKMTVIMSDFHDQTLTLTEEQIEKAWGLSNEKNDAIVKDYLKTIGKIKLAQEAAYFAPNISALQAFVSRGNVGELLSDSIWKVAKQFREELTAHLGIGIANGDSAAVISQRIRQCLENPDILFRRVRDANGKLIASKAMREFHPGQGVYKSSFKNAYRLSRTTTNQAYLLSDHLRWQGMDMVIGVKISLSAQHPDYDFEEICEILEGTYPKEFVFVGWHPSCLCHEVPVMMPKEDFKAYLKGEKPLEAKQITEYSDQFKEYVKGNYERFSNYKSVPYWIVDNQEIIEGILQPQ